MGTALGKLQETVGFRYVDAHVTRVMITWIGDVMAQTCKQFLSQMGEHLGLSIVMGDPQKRRVHNGHFHSNG